MRSLKRALAGVAATSVQRFRLHRRERAFISDASLPLSTRDRHRLINAFSAVDQNIESAHSPAELLFIARTIVGLESPGALVECGTYKGASAAKLSLVARVTGRELFVCDSFRGLQEMAQQVSYHRADGTRRDFRAGEYTGGLQEVQDNIRKWGALEVCHFVQGLFQDTLAGLKADPAVVFMDVDYVASARECLLYLWPQLRAGGYFFTHEAAFVEFVEGMSDGEWWHEHLGECPPLLFGAGHGVDALAPHLAYFKKPTKPIDQTTGSRPRGSRGSPAGVDRR